MTSLVASSAYQGGQLAFTVFLVVLLIALSLRALGVDLRFRAPVSELPVSPPPGMPSSSSIAPPAFIPSIARMSRRARVISAGFALAVALLLAVRLVPADLSGPWTTHDGQRARAAFINGCKGQASAQLDCTCFFDHISQQPAYDTPAKFLALTRSLGDTRTASQAGIAVVTAAASSCQTTAH